MAKKTVKQVKTLQALQVVAAAILAYKQNSNAVEKADCEEIAPCDIYPNGCPKRVSNKTIANDLLDNGYQFSEAELDAAREMVQLVQTDTTLKLLQGRSVPHFTKELLKEVEDIEAQIPAFKVGFLVYLPSVAESVQRRANITEQVAAAAFTSEPLGLVGSKVTVNFELIETRWVEKFGCYTAFGKDEKGNMVSFFTGKPELCVTGKITGKVKRAEPDGWRNNVMVTQLNFVKAA